MKAERQAAEKEKQRLAVERQKAQKEEAAAAASSSSPIDSLKDIDIKAPEIKVPDIKAPELPDIKVPDIKVGERTNVIFKCLYFAESRKLMRLNSRYLPSRCPRLMFQILPNFKRRSSMHRSLMLPASRFLTSK